MPQRVTQIRPHLGDEHVLAVDPPIRPNSEGFWRRRIRPFTGRALSHKALETEQNSSAGMQRLRGQTVSHGVVSGLEARLGRGAIGKSPDDARLEISEGIGLARSGEDIAIMSGRSLLVGNLPVIARADLLDGEEPPELAGDTDGPELPENFLRPELPRRQFDELSQMIAAVKADNLPRAAILIAEPIVTTMLGNAGDPDCPPDSRDDAFDDLQHIDGTRLALYFWPEEMTGFNGNPGYNLPGDGPDQRNIMAHRIFAVERLFDENDSHPWENRGVPLALLGFNQDWTLKFLDSSAVVRSGGMPKPRTSFIGGSGNPYLWQAQVSQFSEHLMALEAEPANALAKNFEFLPPVGILPSDILSGNGRQSFFPSGFNVSLAPVPLEQLNLVMKESAGLAPFSMSAPDQVEMLLAVPARVYEPGLLEMAEVDIRFQKAIDEFTQDRGNWLSRREVIRRRLDQLTTTNRGQPQAWNIIDSPVAELVDAGDQIAPYNAGAVIVQQAGSALRASQLVGAETGLSLSKGDRLFIWIKIPKQDQPKALSIRLNLDKAEPAETPKFGHSWGDKSSLPFFNVNNLPANSHDAEIPTASTWTKLEIDAADIVAANGDTLFGKRFDGIEIAQHSGEVAWGPIGRIDTNGREQYFFHGAVPAGSKLTLGSGATVVSAPAKKEPRFGTTLNDEQLVSADKLAFQSRWTQPSLQRHFITLNHDGFTGLIDDIEKRLTSTNDAIDLGFVRARSDIYRLRQFILGEDAASKLVTSPALADLATRNESARTTGIDLTKFMAKSYATLAEREPDNPFIPKKSTRAAGDVRTRADDRGSGGRTPGLPQSAFLSAGSGARGDGALFMSSTTPLTVFPMASFATIATTAPSESSAPAFVMGIAPAEQPAIARGTSFGKGVVDIPGVIKVPFPEQTIPQYKIVGNYNAAYKPSYGAIKAGIASSQYNSKDIVLQRALPSVVERTVSVAKRIEEAPAKQAYDYALAGKMAIFTTVSSLIDIGKNKTRVEGISLEDLPMPGYIYSGDDATKKEALVTIGDVILDRQLQSEVDGHKSEYSDQDDIGAKEGRHESDYFDAAVSAIDNSVALMRLVEGRVDLYSKFLADAQDTRKALEKQIRAANVRLGEIAIELEEARHDVEVAGALLAEALQNRDETNERRQAVIKEYGNSIIFRRPRFSQQIKNSASAQVLDALIEDPVLTCIAAHDDEPEEIKDYIALFHDAPVSWFPDISAKLSQLNKRGVAVKTLFAVNTRAQIARRFTAQNTASRSIGPLFAVHSAMLAQQNILERRRQDARQLDLAAVSALPLIDLQRQIRKAASMGDIIDGVRSRPRLAKRASALLENIGNVAACLNSEFNEIDPVVRLEWAEILSEHDDGIELSMLSALPEWGAISIEQRRRLQSLVDWLFLQIDPRETEARQAMNQLVRICLLMASHSPVDKLIPATIVTPSPARVGTLIPLRVDVSIIRTGLIGMIRSNSGRSLASVKVEEIGSEIAHARVVQSFASTEILSQGLRINFGGAVRRR
ncbi:hypothetical protein MNBD_ALPHA04-1791 [hydrothermal vent metagenome]|uniref:Uncharacterized protein n=1 Tax=hydrothermal vent metagenome TaxID=652676 RepID=A0A3B0TGD9_9ZZZZ